MSGSRIEDRGSGVADQGSRIADHGSRIVDPGSEIELRVVLQAMDASVSHNPESQVSNPRSAIRDPRSETIIAPIEPQYRRAIERLLNSTGVFRESEVAVALEVIYSYFILPEGDYTALGAFTPGSELLGYVCYGPTPCTVGTWDLYWIAVAPEAQGSGVGSQLLQEVERRLALKDARLVIIETSSQPHYAATRAFYLRRGYEVVARVPDFYTEGDDRLIFAKRIHVT
ncbi:MAG: GNAT family N-acetyltransferase [Gemmatimonadota bacterium]